MLLPRFSFLLIRRPPRSTLVPYTTRLRSARMGPEGPRGPLRPAIRLPGADRRLRRTAPLRGGRRDARRRWEEHTSELQSRQYRVCSLLLETTKVTTSDGRL